MPDPRCRIVNVRYKGNVRPFPGVTRYDLLVANQPHPDVIRFARNLLKRAERGEITGIAAVIGTPQHETGSNWTGFDHISVGRIVGALQVLSHEFSMMTLGLAPVSPFPDERG